MGALKARSNLVTENLQHLQTVTHQNAFSEHSGSGSKVQRFAINTRHVQLRVAEWD